MPMYRCVPIVLLVLCLFESPVWAQNDAPQQNAQQDPADQKPPQITLMGMLSDWIYPEAKFGGAQTSDAGVRDISSIKSKALLTTPAPVDKVLDHYCEKLKVTREGRNIGEKDGERITTDRSVLIQDASVSEPGSVYLIAINEKKSSTTLIISRSDKSESTSIAWSNYRQVWP